MANQHYNLISEPVFEIDGKLYETETWDLNLEKFLIENAGKEIYILESSITTNQMRAIVK